MHQTSNLLGSIGRDAHGLDQLDDRLLADIGLERHGDLITDPSGRLVHRLALNVAVGRALLDAFPFMRGGFARHAD